MSLRRAFHELVNEDALYYEATKHVQILPWTTFGELPASYLPKLEAAKAFLGKKWCLWNKESKKIVEETP